MTDPIPDINHTLEAHEDCGNIDVADAARELGLTPIRAWVADTNRRSRTAGAERTRRCREKAEQHGLKQVSITLPAELHPMLKALAARTKVGEPPETVLADFFPSFFTQQEIDTENGLDFNPTWMDALPAWRRILLRWLIPADVAKPH